MYYSCTMSTRQYCCNAQRPACKICQTVVDDQFGATVWILRQPTFAVLRLQRRVHYGQVWHGMPSELTAWRLRL